MSIKVTAHYLAEIAWLAAIDRVASLPPQEREYVLASPGRFFSVWWSLLCRDNSVDGLIRVRAR